MAKQTKKELQTNYGRDWYLKNRPRILEDLRAKYVPRPERTPAQKAESHKKASRTLKRTLKTLPTGKRRSMQRGLEAGWQKAIAGAENRRKQWAWDIVKSRLDQVSFGEIVRRTGLNAKVVNRILRELHIPRGKKYLMDRGIPFTRGMGTELRKSLGLGYNEFAPLISAAEHTVRTRRVEIWLTRPQNLLDPVEALACVEWRDKIASKLLAKEPSGRDSYDRSSLLLSLYPRLKSEYRLILNALPELRSLVRSNPAADERAIADLFVRKNTLVLQRLLLWLPRLMPFIVREKRAIAGTDPLRHVAVTILTLTFPAPRTVVNNAAHRAGRRLAPAKVRNLFRIYFPDESAKIGLLSPLVKFADKPTINVNANALTVAPPSKKRGERGGGKKEKHDYVVFSEMALSVLPRFKKGKSLAKAGIEALRKGGYSSLEIDCIVIGGHPITAATRWTCKNWKRSIGKELQLQTGKNYLSTYRKLQANRERTK